MHKQDFNLMFVQGNLFETLWCVCVYISQLFEDESIRVAVEYERLCFVATITGLCIEKSF